MLGMRYYSYWVEHEAVLLWSGGCSHSLEDEVILLEDEVILPMRLYCHLLGLGVPFIPISHPHPQSPVHRLGLVSITPFVGDM